MNYNYYQSLLSYLNQFGFLELMELSEESQAYASEIISKVAIDNSLSSFEKDGKIAVLLTAIGKFKESITYFEKSLLELRSLRSDFVWKDFYISICSSFANALDFLNEVDKADQLFQELLDFSPSGSTFILYL